MFSLDRCLVDDLTETVGITETGLHLTGSSSEQFCRKSEISTTEELQTHFQTSPEFSYTCRVMFVTLQACIPSVCA